MHCLCEMRGVDLFLILKALKRILSILSFSTSFTYSATIINIYFVINIYMTTRIYTLGSYLEHAYKSLKQEIAVFWHTVTIIIYYVL